MAERKRSSDMSRQTERVPGARGEVSQQGSSGGELQRKVGSRDERKRAKERPAGATRVHKADEKGSQ
jgi:hypothetical protein